jgi:tRNA(Ile2) C34 agmatinyltransferase TiaS
MSVTDIKKARDEKKPHCEYCGEEEHKGEYQCPRIRKVEIDHDEQVITIYFFRPDDIRADGQ